MFAYTHLSRIWVRVRLLSSSRLVLWGLRKLICYCNDLFAIHLEQFLVKEHDSMTISKTFPNTDPTFRKCQYPHLFLCVFWNSNTSHLDICFSWISTFSCLNHSLFKAFYMNTKPSFWNHDLFWSIDPPPPPPSPANQPSQRAQSASHQRKRKMKRKREREKEKRRKRKKTRKTKRNI